MRRAAAALAARLLAPAPPERLAALRVLVCGFATAYLVGRLPHVVDSASLPAHRWVPVGILRPLPAPPPAPLALGLGLVAPALGLAATFGWHWRASGPLLAASSLWVLTYVNCWGVVLHTEHLLALHLLVLAAAPAADVWARRVGPAEAASDGPGGGDRTAPAPAGRYGWPVRLVSLVTVLTYLLAGLAKLRASGWAWLDGDVLRNHVAHDNLRKAVLGSAWSPVGGALVGAGWAWPPAAALTLAVELGAPLALVWPRARPSWAGAAWGFHVGVLVVMAIFFPYPLSGVAFASLFRLERPGRAVAAAWSRARAGPAAREGSPRRPAQALAQDGR